ILETIADEIEGDLHSRSWFIRRPGELLPSRDPTVTLRVPLDNQKRGVAAREPWRFVRIEPDRDGSPCPVIAGRRVAPAIGERSGVGFERVAEQQLAARPVLPHPRGQFALLAVESRVERLDLLLPPGEFARQ